MKRISTLVVLMMGVVLVPLVPAQAKGITKGTFTGPGLPPGGITVKPDGNGPAGPEGQQLMEGLSGVFEQYKLDAPRVSESELGPRYRLKLAFDFTPRPLRAVLYPYAASAPVVFIPAGQKLGPEFEVPTLSGGWITTSPTFLDTLIELGFPETAPSTETVPARDVPPPAEPQRAQSSSGWAASVIVAGVLIMLLTGLIVLRSRRSATAS